MCLGKRGERFVGIQVRKIVKRHIIVYSNFGSILLHGVICHQIVMFMFVFVFLLLNFIIIALVSLFVFRLKCKNAVKH